MPPLPDTSPDAEPSQPPADPTSPDPPSTADDHAADAPEDWISPSELPRELPSELVGDIVPSAYPRELVRRPLFRPAGSVEGVIAFGIGREKAVEILPRGEILPLRTLTYGILDLSGSYSFGSADLYGGAEILTFDRQETLTPQYRLELSTVPRMYAGARFRAHEETAAGVQLVIAGAGAEYSRYSPSAFFVHRFQLSAWSAVRLGGGIAYHYQEARSARGDVIVHRGSIHGSATVQAQATPLLAFQLSATYVQHKYLEDYGFGFTAFREATYSAAAVISLSSSVDLVPYVSSFATWPGDGKLVCLSLAGRWLP